MRIFSTVHRRQVLVVDFEDVDGHVAISEQHQTSIIRECVEILRPCRWNSRKWSSAAKIILTPIREWKTFSSGVNHAVACERAGAKTAWRRVSVRNVCRDVGGPVCATAIAPPKSGQGHRRDPISGPFPLGAANRLEMLSEFAGANANVRARAKCTGAPPRRRSGRPRAEGAFVPDKQRSKVTQRAYYKISCQLTAAPLKIYGHVIDGSDHSAPHRPVCGPPGSVRVLVRRWCLRRDAAPGPWSTPFLNYGRLGRVERNAIAL